VKRIPLFFLSYLVEVFLTLPSRRGLPLLKKRKPPPPPSSSQDELLKLADRRCARSAPSRVDEMRFLFSFGLS